jgi:hypothetical protein
LNQIVDGVVLPSYSHSGALGELTSLVHIQQQLKHCCVLREIGLIPLLSMLVRVDER